MDKTTNTNELLTAQQAASMLHLSVNTLRRMRLNGEIGYARVGERKVFYPRAEILAYLESRLRPSRAAAAA